MPNERMKARTFLRILGESKGSGLSGVVEELVTGWLADGTVDSLISENGLEELREVGGWPESFHRL